MGSGSGFPPGRWFHSQSRSSRSGCRSPLRARMGQPPQHRRGGQAGLSRHVDGPSIEHLGPLVDDSRGWLATDIPLTRRQSKNNQQGGAGACSTCTDRPTPARAGCEGAMLVLFVLFCLFVVFVFLFFVFMCEVPRIHGVNSRPYVHVMAGRSSGPNKHGSRRP